MLGAVDFDNWDGAKLSLKKLHFKQLGAVEPVAPVEPKKEVSSSKKFEAKKIREASSFKTYKEASDFILTTLASSGWEVNKNLKIPWARSPYLKKSDNKLWFKTQALYKGQSSPNTSLHDDIKEIADMLKADKERGLAYLQKYMTLYAESKVNEDGDEDFKRFMELKAKIKRYEEAKMGCEMTGKMNKAREYQKEITKMTKEKNDLQKKMDKVAHVAKDQRGLDDGYTYELNFSNKDSVTKKMESMLDHNNFYRNTVLKIVKAADKGKEVVVQVRDYSASFKGGILFATIGGEEFQLSKKNVKIVDLQYYLPT
jgi:hypothetical protein